MDLVGLEDIRAAARRLDGITERTPIVGCPWLAGSAESAEGAGSDAEWPAQLWLKLENQQPVGAFKPRGAHNAIARLPAERRARGVVTHSSGNHGQAVAYAAGRFGIPAVVVMPDNSVPLKVERVRDLGAEVVLVDMDQRLSAAERVVAERGMTLIPPYDHRDVIAGQGTVGLEIVEDFPEVEVVLAPIGGGGLISGVATAVKALTPAARVIGVEPELAADARDSLHVGRFAPVRAEQRARTVADGLRSQVTELTLAHITALVDDIVTVSDAEIRAAVATLARSAQITAEPSGAVTTAAWLSRRDQLPDGRTVAILSGGNIDPALLSEILAEQAPAALASPD